MVLPEPPPPPRAAPWLERLRRLLELGADRWLLLVEGPSSAAALVWATACEQDAATWAVSGVDGFAALPPGGAGVVLTTGADAAALNLERTVVQARRLRVILYANPADANVLRREAPDLVDWARARIRIPDSPPWWAVEALDAAVREGRHISWTGPFLRDTLATTGKSWAEVAATAPIEDFHALAASPFVAVRGVQGRAGVERAQVCLAEAGFRGVAVFEGELQGPTVDTREVPLARSLQELRAAGAGRASGALAAALAGRPGMQSAVSAHLCQHPHEAAALAALPPTRAILAAIPSPDPPGAAPPAPFAEASMTAPGERLGAAWNLLSDGFVEDAERLASGIAPSDAERIALPVQGMIAARRAWLREGRAAGEGVLRALVTSSPLPFQRAVVLAQWGRWLAADGYHTEAALRWREAVDAYPPVGLVLGLSEATRKGLTAEPDRAEVLRRVDADLLPQVADGPDRARLLTRKAMLLGDLDRWLEALAVAREARAAVGEDGPLDEWSEAVLVELYQEAMLGDPHATHTFAELSRRAGATAVSGPITLAAILLRRGRPADATRVVDDLLLPGLAVPGAERLGDTPAPGILPGVFEATGRVDAGARLLRLNAERSVEPAHKVGWLLALASLLLAAGRVADAGEALAQCSGLALPPAKGAELAALRRDHAARRGEFREALRIEEEEIGPHLSVDAPEWLVHLGRLAQLADQSGDLEGAERIVRERAVPHAEATGSPEQAARVHGSLAALLLRKGEATAALQLLTEKVLPYLHGAERARYLPALAAALGARGEVARAREVVAEARQALAADEAVLTALAAMEGLLEAEADVPGGGGTLP